MTPAEKEVSELCAELIRVDSSNYGDGSGPGERAAAEVVMARLSEVGIDATYVESAPGRGNVVTRVEGTDPSLPALLVHGHLDVVPANAADWTVDPFAGEVRDGYIWGRGAVDMKDMDAMMLAVLRQRRGVSDQSRLGSRQRRENLTGALTTAAGGAGLLLAGPVVLVDDLMTTGASLAEAARAVTSAVYSARVREEMEAYRTGRSRKEGNPVYRASELWRAYGAGHVICAAVVAASPDSVVEKQELTKNVHRCR